MNKKSIRRKVIRYQNRTGANWADAYRAVMRQLEENNE